MVVVLGGGASGRCLDHEGAAPLSGVSVLERRLQKDPQPLHHVRTQQEVTCYEPGRGILQNPTMLVL